MKSQSFREAAAKWLEKSESDFRHAKRSLEAGDLDWAQFASQQAAEKALKAVFLARGLGLVREHDLTVFALKLKAPEEVVGAAAFLNSFYSASRYPDVVVDMDAETAEKAATNATKSATVVLEWCRQQTKT